MERVVTLRGGEKRLRDQSIGSKTKPSKQKKRKLSSKSTTQNFFNEEMQQKMTVVIIHGLNDGAEEMNDLKSLILQHHPNIEVIVPKLYEYIHSITNLWTQVKAFGEVIKEVSDNSDDGIHIIGFSQGGLIARGVIQTVENLNIRSFIALSSPLNGQFGDTSYLSWIPTVFRKEVSYLFYTEHMQHLVSIAEYWKDPGKLHMYEEYSEFLAPLNNESINKDNKKFQMSWKTNFEKINNLVLIGGKDDGVITPWQSALMGSYDKNEQVQPMEELEIYKDDVFGLKTLDEAGKIHKYQFDGIEHTHWHGNEHVFLTAISPWLK